jgi:hypothetical protein
VRHEHRERGEHVHRHVGERRAVGRRLRVGRHRRLAGLGPRRLPELPQENGVTLPEPPSGAAEGGAPPLGRTPPSGAPAPNGRPDGPRPGASRGGRKDVSLGAGGLRPAGRPRPRPPTAERRRCRERPGARRCRASGQRAPDAPEVSQRGQRARQYPVA